MQQHTDGERFLDLTLKPPCVLLCHALQHVKHLIRGIIIKRAFVRIHLNVEILEGHCVSPQQVQRILWDKGDPEEALHLV